jgi:hypothetical protein
VLKKFRHGIGKFTSTGFKNAVKLNGGIFRWFEEKPLNPF